MKQSQVATLYQELFPHFSSPFANVGLDEPFDLGPPHTPMTKSLIGAGKGRSKAACEQHGQQRVYLNYLLRVGCV